ncbi:ribosomal protein L36-domain-containing protein [Chytridium lagenaria]|nr:ribosomal protein L36-domain-containing protein [Chytridium lagenaria]
MFHRHLLSRMTLLTRSFTTLLTRTTTTLFPSTTSSSLTFLRPTPPPMVQGVRSYKTKSSLKLRCEHCFFAKRRGKLRVICKENPKHKQVQI